jgi:hypothetical protein
MNNSVSAYQEEIIEKVKNNNNILHTGWLEDYYCYDEELASILNSISIEE